MRLRAAAIATLAALSLLSAQEARAAGLQPIEPSVDGGEGSWHPKRDFALRWSNPPGTIVAVHYRLLYPSGGVAIEETTLDWPATAIQHLSVPDAPGAYTAEVWLEGDKGTLGAPVAAKLRYDNAAPGHVEPLPVGAWIGRTAFPYAIHLAHPSGPQPLSGISGYAVSIDGTPDGSPCVLPGICSETETDLQGGVIGDSLAIGELPEGTSYLHAVAVSGTGMRSANPGTTVLHVDKTDPATRLAGYAGGWSSRPLTLTATATDAASGMLGSGSAFTAMRVDGGAPVTAAGDTATTTVISSGVHTVAYYARDAAGNVDDGGVSNGRPGHAPATALVKIDREAPQVAFVGAQDPLDPEWIKAEVSDSLSSPDPSHSSIAIRGVGSGERFVELPTESSGTLLRAHWDSEAYPRGEYEFRAIAYDLAGNSASTLNRVNGTAMRLSNPLKTTTTLLSGFGGSVLNWHRCSRQGTRRRCHQETVRDFAERPTARTVPYGRGTSFSGRLVAGRRAPLAGMAVQVIERFDPGAVPSERLSTVKTGPGGGFTVHLEPGPSRRLLAVAPATATLHGSSSQPLRLAVRSGVRMRASSTTATIGGRPVVFRGSVGGAGAAIPADGKIVQLQFRLPGLPWSEFRTIRTDPQGHFRYAYGFSDDDSRGVRFQFRALAPGQAGWPFEPAGSRPVAVRGR